MVLGKDMGLGTMRVCVGERWGVRELEEREIGLEVRCN